MNPKKFAFYINVFERDKNIPFIRLFHKLSDLFLVFGSLSYSFFKLGIVANSPLIKNFFLIKITIVCLIVSFIIELYILYILVEHVYIEFYLKEKLTLNQKFILIRICSKDFLIYVLKRVVVMCFMLHFFNS